MKNIEGVQKGLFALTSVCNDLQIPFSMIYRPTIYRTPVSQMIIVVEGKKFESRDDEFACLQDAIYHLCCIYPQLKEIKDYWDQLKQQTLEEQEAILGLA